MTRRKRLEQKCAIKEYAAAHAVFELAIEAIDDADFIITTKEFRRAVKLLTNHRVWTLGMGKAGLIAHKLASTIACNGIPAGYINAGEALHGDFGAIQKGDVLVAFSNSGKTGEVIQVADKAKSIGAKVILITGETQSEIAKRADVVICYGKIEEACPLKLTPTTSVTVMLIIADALAMASQVRVNLTYKRYAINHHAGYLGQIARLRSNN